MLLIQFHFNFLKSLLKNQKILIFNSELVFMTWGIIDAYIFHKTFFFKIKTKNQIYKNNQKKKNTKMVILLAHDFEIFWNLQIEFYPLKVQVVFTANKMRYPGSIKRGKPQILLNIRHVLINSMWQCKSKWIKIKQIEFF